MQNLGFVWGVVNLSTLKDRLLIVFMEFNRRNTNEFIRKGLKSFIQGALSLPMQAKADALLFAGGFDVFFVVEDAGLYDSFLEAEAAIIGEADI